MTLSSEQIQDLLTAHCHRVISNMDEDTLVSYAMQMMMSSFDKDPGQGNPDLAMLVQDIFIAEDEDEDSVSEFIAGVVGNELADEIMKNTQF